jgi:hypothetical protein
MPQIEGGNMHKGINLILILVALLSFTLIYGCEKGPTTISYGEPAIFAELTRDEQREQTIQNVIHVSVGGTRLVPVVRINNDTLELYSYRRDNYTYTYYSEFRENLSVAPGEECELVVYHDEGEASATIALPGDFGITVPKGDSSLRQNEDLIVNWSTSKGAERYKLEIDLSYYYVDTSGASNRFDLDTSFYATTNITIPKERLFPPEVDSVDGGFSNISIYSESGPWIGHTTEGNISGEGVGYFIASNQTPEIRYFGIGNGVIVYGPFEPIDSIIIIKISPPEQFETHLEYLRTHDPKFTDFPE